MEHLTKVSIFSSPKLTPVSLNTKQDGVFLFLMNIRYFPNHPKKACIVI